MRTEPEGRRIRPGRVLVGRVAGGRAPTARGFAAGIAVEERLARRPALGEFAIERL